MQFLTGISPPRWWLEISESMLETVELGEFSGRRNYEQEELDSVG